MSLRVRHILDHILGHFGFEADDVHLCRDDQKVASSFIRILADIEYADFDIEEEEGGLEKDDDSKEDPTWQGDDAAERVPIFDGVRFSGGVKVSENMVREAIAYYRQPKKGFRTLKSIHKIHTFVATPNDLSTLRSCEKQGKTLLRIVPKTATQMLHYFTDIFAKTRYDSLKMLHAEMKTIVAQKLNDGVTLHDYNLKALALGIARDLNIDDFMASPSWILRFKRNMGLVSRKITRFVTRRQHVDQAKIEEEARRFVAERKKEMEEEGKEIYFNADQSGINLELPSPRSLAFKGAKKVERVIQSASATTHSYTIMPLHNAAGRLGAKLYVQLQERNGVFPPNVTLFNADNLYVVAGTSHIMTKDHMKRWITDVVVPEINEKAVLIVDSWPSFKDHATIATLIPDGKQLRVCNIPAKATSLIQPLDLYFFLHFKAFVKRIRELIFVNDLEFSVYQRNNVLKVLSLIYSQFCAPRFANYLRYAWKKGGYVDDHPGEFETPVQYCFGVEPNCECHSAGCEKFSNFVCAYCEFSYCFEHFVTCCHRC